MRTRSSGFITMPRNRESSPMNARKSRTATRPKQRATTSSGSGTAVPKTSAEKLVEQAEGLEALAKLAPFLRLFGKRGRDAADTLRGARGMADQARELTRLPTRFNAVLGPRGWIAFERMNHELLRQAAELAEGGRFKEADALLVEAFDEESLRFQLNSMTAVAAYRPRATLLELAAVDYHAGRYHAAVPVILAQIDGIVADVAGKALFTKTKDILPKLLAWDSISAREGGLPDLVTLMASPRHQTTDGPIEVPYRHGILHGRDLGYASKLVAAKAWAALFSLREWAIKYERGETEPPPVEPAPSLRETLQRLADVERQRRQIEAWQPRADLGPLDEDEEPALGTPEEAIHRWLTAWKMRDFGDMATWTQARRQLRQPHLASQLESMFGFRELIGFRTLKVHDAAAALTEVVAELRLVGVETVVLMTANIVFEDAEGNPVVRGTGPGRWGVNEISALRRESADKA
jgi:hypothetical protein